MKAEYERGDQSAHPQSPSTTAAGTLHNSEKNDEDGGGQTKGGEPAVFSKHHQPVALGMQTDRAIGNIDILPVLRKNARELARPNAAPCLVADHFPGSQINGHAPVH